MHAQLNLAFLPYKLSNIQNSHGLLTHHLNETKAHPEDGIKNRV